VPSRECRVIRQLLRNLVRTSDGIRVSQETKSRSVSVKNVAFGKWKKVSSSGHGYTGPDTRSLDRMMQLCEAYAASQVD
jgi:hypothetical protein